jgi:cystathionine beta-lyase/cystathionine gamma-synthase
MSSRIPCPKHTLPTAEASADSQSAPETTCAHAGQGRHDGDPLVVPIVQSTTFCRDGINSTASHAYSRCSNPTVAALEEALGFLEGAPPAVCFATGLAAEAALFLALLKSGDHVLCSSAVYGGTARLLQQLLPDFGVEASFVRTSDLDAVAAVLERRSTKLLFIETPANPTLDLTDILAVAQRGHDAGALIAVDNTFLTAVLQRPLELGADISVYSTTKYIDGHSAALGGALVSRNEELLARLRFIRKCTGGIQTPFGAFLTLQGLKTLPLRIRRQSETAGEVAQWLLRRDAVERVYYPAFADLALARRQHREYHGAVVSFELRGGMKAGVQFLQNVRLCRLAEHVGSVETLVTHPATMTHADTPRQQRLATGVTDGLVRLSVGLEPAREIIADLERAIGCSQEDPGAGEEASCLAIA